MISDVKKKRAKKKKEKRKEKKRSLEENKLYKNCLLFIHQNDSKMSITDVPTSALAQE